MSVDLSRGVTAAVAAAVAVVALSACAFHADLKPLPSASNPALSLEHTVAQAGGGAWPERQWWKIFGDPQLESLIAEGLAASPSMEAALARLDAARVRLGSARAALLPGVAADLSAIRSRYSENGFFPPPLGGKTLWEYKGDVDLRWELDFWGRQRSALQAARKNAQAAAVDRAGAELMLSESIARRYIEWQQLEDQLEISRAFIEQRQRLFDLTDKRVRAGLDTNVELRQAEASLPDARASVTALEGQVAVLRIELAALLGAGPDRALTLTAPNLRSPEALLALPTLIPAELLARRPDVISMRLRAEGAASQADAARADLLPNINLAAVFGFDSTDLDNWARYGSRFYNAGPSLKLPIFNTGRHAALTLRTANYDEAAAAYRQTLIDAVKDVASALTELRAADAQQRDAASAVNAEAAAYEIAQHRYQVGLDAYTQVLLSEARLLGQRQRVADLNARKLDASVRLIAALGGGLPAQKLTKSE